MSEQQTTVGDLFEFVYNEYIQNGYSTDRQMEVLPTDMLSEYDFDTVIIDDHKDQYANPIGDDYLCIYASKSYKRDKEGKGYYHHRPSYEVIELKSESLDKACKKLLDALNEQAFIYFEKRGITTNPNIME